MADPLIAIINGSLHGDSDQSNTLLLLKHAEQELLRLGARAMLLNPEPVALTSNSSSNRWPMFALGTSRLLKAIDGADGLIIGSGTYWGGVSSTLQRFLEEATPTEGTVTWLGKPVGIIVSEHSSGGQLVLANLMLTLSNFGCVLPPQGGMVYSRISQALKYTAKDENEEWGQDVWGLEDIATICETVILYARHRLRGVRSWIVDRDDTNLHRRWAVAK